MLSGQEMSFLFSNAHHSHLYSHTSNVLIDESMVLTLNWYIKKIAHISSCCTLCSDVHLAHLANKIHDSWLHLPKKPDSGRVANIFSALREWAANFLFPHQDYKSFDCISSCLSAALHLEIPEITKASPAGMTTIAFSISHNTRPSVRQQII